MSDDISMLASPRELIKCLHEIGSFKIAQVIVRFIQVVMTCNRYHCDISIEMGIQDRRSPSHPQFFLQN